MTLGREISMWLHPRRLLHPQVILFLLIRYATVPALVVTSYSTWGHFEREEECINREQVTVAVVQFVVACVFSWRTIAIWRRARWVVASMVCCNMSIRGRVVHTFIRMRVRVLSAHNAATGRYPEPLRPSPIRRRNPPQHVHSACATHTLVSFSRACTKTCGNVAKHARAETTSVVLPNSPAR